MLFQEFLLVYLEELHLKMVLFLYGIESEKFYNVRLTGGSGIKLYDNLSNAENDISAVNIKNQVGIGASNLKFVSRVNEKHVGDIGHPIQWDSTNQNWYVGVNSASSGAADFFNTLSVVTGSFSIH